MHGDHAGGHARHQDRRGPRAERERDLRAHQHQRLPACVGAAPQRTRRGTPSAGCRRRRRSAACAAVADAAVKPLPIGPSSAERLADRLPRQRVEPGADDLVEHLDRSPRSASARMIDSGRRIGSSASQVRCTKLPGVGRCGAARRVQPDHELLARGSSWCARTSASSTKIVPRCSRPVIRLSARAGLRMRHRPVAHDRREHRHAHGDAVRDLLLDRPTAARRRRRSRSRRRGSSGRDA